MATNNAINIGVVAGGGNTYTFPAATDTLVGRTSTDTLTNKTIALGSNTVSGTKAQFDTAVTDGNFLYTDAIGVSVQAYDADLTTWAGITPGTGVGTALAVNVGSAGAFVTFNGALGTPSSGVATNLTGTAASLTAGTATLANTVASANEASDTTCFPLFITASGTQSLATKNNTNLTFNSSTASLGSTIFNAGTGFQIGGAASSGKILKANGTNFVASTETYAAPGTSGNVMTSDGTNWVSSAPTGGGGWTVISSGQLGSANATLMNVSSISTNYDAFRLRLFHKNSAASIRDIWLRFNSDTGSNYDYQSNYVSSTSATNNTRQTGQAKIILNSNVSFGLSQVQQFEIQISKPLTTTPATIRYSSSQGSGTDLKTWDGSAWWNNTSSKITGISVVDEDGTGVFDTGSFYVLEGFTI